MNVNDYCPEDGNEHRFVNETIFVPRWSDNEVVTGRKRCKMCGTIRVSDPERFSRYKPIVDARDASIL